MVLIQLGLILFFHVHVTMLAKCLKRIAKLFAPVILQALLATVPPERYNRLIRKTITKIIIECLSLGERIKLFYLFVWKDKV